MTHEVGHMIDYHCDHISEKRDFMDVFDCYQYLLKKYVDEKASKTEKAQLLGSGKYNISYYQQSTEVFARCFEMYPCEDNESRQFPLPAGDWVCIPRG